MKTQSMHFDSFEGRSTTQNYDFSKIQDVKLPKLESALDYRKNKFIDRRFNSVKTRDAGTKEQIAGIAANDSHYNNHNNRNGKGSRNSRTNISTILQNSKTNEELEESKLPSNCLSVTEALPLAIFKKKKLLEKREEEDDVHIK